MQDHIIYIQGLEPPKPERVKPILRHLLELSRKYSVASATHFVSKLTMMQKNLARGLKKGPRLLESKTWPGLPELTVFKAILAIFPTDDRDHSVVSPALLLMRQYLRDCRIRQLSDIASGLFICSLWLQYEQQQSNRCVQEVLNFLVTSLLHLAPHRSNELDKMSDTFPLLDFESEYRIPLRLDGDDAKTVEPRKPDMAQLLTLKTNGTAQDKADLLSINVDLILNFAEQWTNLPAFVKFFVPVVKVLAGIQKEQLASGFQVSPRGFLNA